MGRSTNVESASRAAQGSMAGIEWVTRMQRARSRALFRTSEVHRGVWQLLASRSAPPGQKWPERPRSLSEPRGRLFEYLLGSAEPSARPHRSKWLHGSPDETTMSNGCRVLQASAQCASKSIEASLSLLRLFDKGTSTVPGSHRALPGDLGGGRGEPRSAPTAWTAPTSGSRIRKGVNQSLLLYLVVFKG